MFNGFYLVAWIKFFPKLIIYAHPSHKQAKISNRSDVFFNIFFTKKWLPINFYFVGRKTMLHVCKQKVI